MSTASIPWFKKYSSKYKNASGDTDLFKMGDFPTYGRGLDHEYAKKGNSAMLSYLHEDFVRSALNIALGSKKVIRPAEVGFKNKPVSDIANENDFDLLYRIADGSYSMLELKQDFKNVSGSVTGFMNKKLANLEKENPVLAKKVSSMIAVSNRPKFIDPTGKNPAGQFSEFEMAAASIVKDKYSNVDPSISAKLTKVTDGLLRRYEAKKNSYSKGFIPNFASRSEMIRDLIRFNLESTPDVKNKNVFGSKTTLFRGVKNRGGRYSGQFGRDIFEQSNNYSQAKNSFDYFRNTDINEIANDHVSEKKLLPFVSASMDEDIAKYFARGRQDSSFSDEGKVGSKTIKNSRIFSAESIRKFTNKYGQEALKQLMMEHSTWGSFGSGKGIAMNFQSFSDKKGFEGTDFAKEISFLSKGFVPNFANFIDVDTLGKNSVHYSGDLMKLIKDIESSIGRNLSSGELRFLSSPKTDLSKLNDPKILNRFINSERKGGFAGFAKGFLPNFAYKQAVMGLEESMSGNKAILDTSTGPFPFIRNTGQANFADAVADHGGLNNALSDSMRGQKAAGLMNKGFVPNFAVFGPSYPYLPSGNSSGASTGSSNYYPSGNPAQSQPVSPTFKPPTAATNVTFKPEDIDKAIKNFINSVQMADEKLSIFESTFGGRTKIISSELTKLKNNLSKSGVSGAELNNAMNSAAKEIKGQQSKFAKGLEKSSTTLAFAGPVAAGLIEQAVYGNKQRTEMTSGERIGQSALSSGLTSLTTGASIGASFGPWGAAIGAAAGAAVGLAQALGAASLSADEFAKIAEEYKSATQQNVSAGQSYIDNLKTLGSSTDPEIIKKASTSLELNFKNIKDVKLQDAFKAAGNDVDKLTKALSTYEQKRGRIEAQKSSLAQSKALAGLDIKDLGKRGYATVKSGPRNAIDIAANEANFSMMASEYSTFFDNIDSLTADQYKQFKEALNKMELSTGNVDEENLRKVLMTFSQLDAESVDYLVGIGENVTEVGSTAGRVLRNNLDKVREAYKKNLEQGKGVLSPEQKKALSTFAEFRKNLLNTISDDLNNATQALKSFDSGTSLAQLVPTKLKEINDLVSNSIINNLDAVRGFSFKQTQAKTTAQFQTQEFNRLTARTMQEQGLKTAQTNTLFRSQAAQAILGSELIPGVSSQQAIQEFLSQGAGFDKQGIKSFATKLAGKNDKEVEALSSKLEGILIQFKESTREIESQTKYKLQELSYNQVINKLNETTILKQIDLEKEKLKITLGQKDAANRLRDAVEKAKIAANERLELTRIQTGGEFRYLGLNKRQEFESRQVDLKSIFDQEQVIAENQAIADARRSIIEIAAQNANTEAQNKNTEALFDSIDSNAANFENLGNLLSTLGMKEVGSGFISGAQEAKARNKFNREQFNQSRQSIQLAKISNFGVENNATIGDTIAKLRSKMQEKDITEETKMSIQETITTLEIASNQIGSNATIFEAKSAQMRQDFEQSAGFVNNMVIGFQSLNNQADVMVDQLGRNLPSMFADGLVDGIKAAIRESDNLGEALMGVASKFLDEISTAMMRSAIYGILGNIGMGVPGISNAAAAGGMKQKGGYIRAQSGMYISGTGSGDKYPALLENGEYVLNRNAVMAMGGPSELDKLNFSMAPRFASGGSFVTELNDLNSMEEGMTTYGLENSKLYNELRDLERAKQAEKRRKAFERKKMIAGIVGSVAGIAASFGIAKAAGSFGSSLKKDFGDVTMNVTPEQLAQNANLAQKGGHIGTRLSDTIPAYAEGGLYSSPIIKKYGVGMQNGGMYGGSSNNSNTVSNTNATNSFNFNTTVNRDGTIQMGADSTSYKQQDVELSNNLNSQVYKTVLDVIKQQQRFGGTLAGTRRPI
jgi:hypothetical protein